MTTWKKTDSGGYIVILAVAAIAVIAIALFASQQMTILGPTVVEKGTQATYTISVDATGIPLDTEYESDGYYERLEGSWALFDMGQNRVASGGNFVNITDTQIYETEAVIDFPGQVADYYLLATIVKRGFQCDDTGTYVPVLEEEVASEVIPVRETSILWTYELPAGRNYISLAGVTDISTAAELMAAIGPSCTAISRYNSATQTSEGWTAQGMGTNFALSCGEGYIVWVSEDSSVMVTGTPCSILSPQGTLIPTYNSLQANQYALVGVGATDITIVGTPLEGHVFASTEIAPPIIKGTPVTTLKAGTAYWMHKFYPVPTEPEPFTWEWWESLWGDFWAFIGSLFP